MAQPTQVCLHSAVQELTSELPLAIDSPALYQNWMHECPLCDEMQKYGLSLCPNHQPRSEVYYHVSHSFSSGGFRQLYMHPSVTFNVSLSLPLSLSLPGVQYRGTLRWWVSQMELKCLVPQLSSMQIALSTDYITENSQQSVLFDAFFPFIFCHDVIVGGAAASLINVSNSHLLIFLSLCLYFAAGLPPLLHGLLQYLQYSHTVLYTVFLFSLAVPVT